MGEQKRRKTIALFVDGEGRSIQIMYVVFSLRQWLLFTHYKKSSTGNRGTFSNGRERERERYGVALPLW
jgi:hypothetical protein